MAKGNILVNGKNNITARANAIANIQNDLQNKNTASNTVTTPNLPTPTRATPLNLNLQKAQQPVQTKLNNLNTATNPIQSNPIQNTNMGVGTVAPQPTQQSRFIGFQQPQQNKAKSVSNLTKPALFIETAERKANNYNATKDKVLLDFQADVYKNQGLMGPTQIREYYPEFRDEVDKLYELQKKIRPKIQSGMGMTAEQLEKEYSDLLPSKTAEEAKKESEKNNKNLIKLKDKLEKVLETNSDALSDAGREYLYDRIQLAGTVDWYKNNYRIQGNANDYEILQYAMQNNPEVQNLYDKVKEIKLTEMDNATIDGNSKSIIASVVSGLQKMVRQANIATQNFVAEQNELTTEPNFFNTTLNVGANIMSAADRAVTGGTRLAMNQARDSGDITNSNWQQNLQNDVLDLGGGTVEALWALGSSIFEYANLTDAKPVSEWISNKFTQGDELLDTLFKGDITGQETLLSPRYNSLDEQRQAEFRELVTAGIFKAGHGATRDLKMRGKVGIDVMTNAFARAWKDPKRAEFQNELKNKGIMDSNGKIKSGSKKDVAKVIASEFTKTFKDNLKDNFSRYNEVLKNRQNAAGIKTAGESIGEIKEGVKNTVEAGKDLYNKGKNAVDTAKEGVNKVVEGVQNIKPGEIVKNTSEAVGKGVKATSDLGDSGKNAVTRGKNAVTNAVKENVVEPFKKGYEGVKNSVNENIVEPYNKGRGKTNFNEELGTQQQQQGISNRTTSVSDDKINGENYTQKNTESKTLNKVQAGILKSYNKMNPTKITEFKEKFGVDYGQALYDMGYTESRETNVPKIEEDTKEIYNQKKELLNSVEGKFQDRSWTDMLEEMRGFAKRTVDYDMMEKYEALAERYYKEGMTMKEWNDMREEFTYKIKTKWVGDNNSEKVDKANNIYTASRKFGEKVAEEHGIKNLGKMNRDIAMRKFLSTHIGDKAERQSANNIVGLNDWIMLAESASNPYALAGLLSKKVLEQPKSKNAILNAVVGGRKNRSVESNKRKVTTKQTKEDIESVNKGTRLQKEMQKGETPALPNGIKLREVKEVDARKPKNKVTSKKKTEKREESNSKKKPVEKKSESSKEQPKNAITSKKSAVTDYVNETPQTERGLLEESERESELLSNETPQTTEGEMQPKKQEQKTNGGMQRQTGTARNATFTNTILDIIESNGGLKDGYLKVKKDGFEPLYIEEIGGGKIAIGQTYIQEGDVMFDPEIVFKVDEDGRLQAETIRNDSMGIYDQPIKSNDPFLETWEANLREFIKSVDEGKKTNIIGKNNSLTTKPTTNEGQKLGGTKGGISEGVQGDKGSRDLQRIDGLPGTERNDSGRSGGDVYQKQLNDELTSISESAGHAIGQQQRKLLTRGEARAINQNSKEILEKHNFSTNPKDYTAEEIETLRQYEGAGGLTNKGEDTKGVLDQFYTPQSAIDAVWHLVDKYKKGGDIYTVLEPTVGTGRFIRDRENEKYEGHEIDKVPGTIAQILHPDANISVGDFEDLFMDFTGRRPADPGENWKFDIVVGNPPYSQRITPQQKNGLEPKIKRSEEFFIKKGIDVLNDGGTLAMVVPSTFLTNPMSYAKEQIFDNATLVDAYRLPEGIFPYTQVGTDIVVFKKSKSLFNRENNLSDNKRFEQHPEKVLGEIKEKINRFGKLEKYVDGGEHPLDKLHAIYEDKKPETKKEQIENYSPVETKEETPVKEKTTTAITGEKNKVTAKTVAKKKPTKKATKIENQTLIKGDKTDIHDSVFGQGELDKRLLDYSKKTDINGYVQGPVKELVDNDPKNLNFYKHHAMTNDLYFAGDIYEKLEQLEKEYTLSEAGYMSEAQYKKQKEGLLAVMPEPYTIENHPFVSPLDQNVMEFETNEIGNVYDSSVHDYVDKKLPLKEVFLEWFRRNVSSSTINKNLAREYINGESMRSTSGYSYGLTDEEKAARARHEKSVVMEQVNEIFNDWLWNKLDREVQQKIIDKFNRENRSYVVPRYENMALATRGISKTFSNKELEIRPGQIEGINFLLSKGAGIVAHGVGHGKTIEGVVATREAQLRGWNKRPLIVAPGPTLYAQWVRTIKELYPDWEIVNLGGLTKSDIKRLKADLGDDPRNWVKDGQVAILSMQGFGDNIEFRPNTQRDLEAKLHDVMETKDLNVRQSESLDKKISQMLAPGKGTNTEKYSYSEKGDFLRTMYTSLLESDKEEFINDFVERTKEEYPDLKEDVIRADAEAMWKEKPVLLEDLGIDHITVDEMHNFKNVFTSAKMQEDESGRKEVNRYGQIIRGNTSARGQKMFLATQYILDRNNNRNVFGLTATPFNNQPIEIYNMLSFVGRNELEKMGLTNINDFFSRFAEFREGLAPKASGTELEYKFIMKDFANARDLQRTITQFINYKGDSEDLIKPEKKLKVPVLKMSKLQKKVQSDLEYMALAKENQGDVLKATNGMISNLVSPFIVAGTRAPTGWEDFLDNSPKLKYFADVLKELRKSGKEDGMFIYMPVGQEFHELYAEALSEYAGVPREKIGIIDSKTSAKKDEIAEKFRNGDINVLIGGKNTAEGIDLQNNGYITAITSVGWNPTERVQVDGRVWRQGNFNNEVLSVVPLIENSADVIFMGKADQKGSRINNALEQMLFGGDGDLSADEMMMSLMTEPEKKARTQINIQSQEIDKEIYGLNSQKDRLQELKRRIKDAEQDPEEIQKQIDNEKQSGRTWSIPRLKEELKTAKKAREWIEAYKENNGELPSIEDIDNQTLELEKQVDELRARQSELKNNEEVLNNLIEEIKQKQADDAKGVKSYQDYIDDIKSDFKNAKRFGSKEELKEYLDNKKNNVIANGKNNVTSGKSMAARTSRPSIVMRLDENGNPLSNKKNKVTTNAEAIYKPVIRASGEPTVQIGNARIKQSTVTKAENYLKQYFPNTPGADIIEKIDYLNSNVRGKARKGTKRTPIDEIGYKIKDSIILDDVYENGYIVIDNGKDTGYMTVSSYGKRIEWHVGDRVYGILQKKGLLK